MEKRIEEFNNCEKMCKEIMNNCRTKSLSELQKIHSYLHSFRDSIEKQKSN